MWSLSPLADSVSWRAFVIGYGFFFWATSDAVDGTLTLSVRAATGVSHLRLSKSANHIPLTIECLEEH